MRWSRAFPAAAALLLAVLTVGPAWSQGRTEDLKVDEKKSQGKVFQSLRDFGSFGPSLGVMQVFGGSLGKNARAKPLLQGVFRFHFNEAWVGVGDFGFGWNSFKDGGDTVLTFTYGTVGAARRFATRYRTDLRLGAGAGFYRWNYKFHGKSLLDLQTFHPYRGMSPGGYLGLDAERRVANHVTLTGLLQQHYVFTADKDQFDTVFTKNHALLSFRIGINYHFSPYEGILWERKTTKTIRLESGKEGK